VVQVVIETVAVQQECPDCENVGVRVKDRALVRIKDLPLGGRQVDVWWRANGVPPSAGRDRKSLTPSNRERRIAGSRLDSY
jgi:hypothetical protein